MLYMYYNSSLGGFRPWDRVATKIVLLFVKTHTHDSMSCGSLIWMFGSGMARTVVFDRGLSSAVHGLKWDLFSGSRRR
jgi:hypothetical protein